MNAMLDQFLSEAREALEGIGAMLMQLETAPDDQELMAQLFRSVHTLKGNSGLFDFPEMTRVLHAGEDLMDAVRHGEVTYSQQLADRLLDAMDFVSILCDDVATGRPSAPNVAAEAVRLAQALRALLPMQVQAESMEPVSGNVVNPSQPTVEIMDTATLLRIPEDVRISAWQATIHGAPLWWVRYQPSEGCFFQGEDPLHQARIAPGILWGGMEARVPWPPLAELDAYRCMLDFTLLSNADRSALDEHFRYVPEQVQILALNPVYLVLPQGDPNGGPVYEDFVSDAMALLEANDLSGLRRAVRSMLELSSSALWLASALRWLDTLLNVSPVPLAAVRKLIESLRTLTVPDWSDLLDAAPELAPTLVRRPWSAAVQQVLEVQRTILSLPDDAAWLSGRIKAVAVALQGCLQASGLQVHIPDLFKTRDAALQAGRASVLLDWLDIVFVTEQAASTQILPATVVVTATAESMAACLPESNSATPTFPSVTVSAEAEAVTPPLAEAQGGNSIASTGSKSLKVEQSKIDRLMNLIGEMVVAKNAIPYLANRAEQVYGSRELAREIKAQYAVINRISQEMQDAIMQVSLMPVSFIMQRFPRLVRDTSRRLGKEVQLVLEGQETAADKNIIESLGDPLVHMVRNSLDHGLETPEQRVALGKPAVGTLKITAKQESDRVLIEISDDGRGIDPVVVKQKAFDKGLIDQATLGRITDAEAVNLIFMAGFSTADAISDLSGRGVGMDVVRAAVERVNGQISVSSVKGQGTQIRLSLPLSMAVSSVMMVNSDRQMFGIPMDVVLETVRVPGESIRSIKQSRAAVLRGRLVPLFDLNQLLGLASPPLANDMGEYATLLVRVGDDVVGLLVDEFHGTADIILKPLLGVLSGMRAYAGSALMGDGSVLMVLNVKELW
jgi:two-component system chemotaxis sensor kinase CheA